MIKAVDVDLVVGRNNVSDLVRGARLSREDYSVFVVERSIERSVVCRGFQVWDPEGVELACVEFRVACAMSAASAVAVYADTAAMVVDMLGDKAVVCLEIIFTDHGTHCVVRSKAVLMMIQDRYERMGLMVQ